MVIILHHPQSVRQNLIQYRPPAVRAVGSGARNGGPLPCTHVGRARRRKRCFEEKLNELSEKHILDSKFTLVF